MAKTFKTKKTVYNYDQNDELISKTVEVYEEVVEEGWSQGDYYTTPYITYTPTTDGKE